MDNNDKNKLKEVGLKRFLYEAVSELWSYEIWTFLITTILIAFIRNLAKMLIITRDDALTTSNLFYLYFFDSNKFLVDIDSITELDLKVVLVRIFTIFTF